MMSHSAANEPKPSMTRSAKTVSPVMGIWVTGSKLIVTAPASAGTRISRATIRSGRVMFFSVTSDMIDFSEMTVSEVIDWFGEWRRLLA